MNVSENILKFVEKCEKDLSLEFKRVDDIALYNEDKVLSAFRKYEVGQRHFAQTNGYGYDDIGRDTLCKIYADVFKCEAAIVSPLIVSGTHALTLALMGVLRPNDELIAISGAPYDTLMEVINGEGNGSLKDHLVSYKQVNLVNGDFDYDKIEKAISPKTKMIFIGRSRGYEWRDALSFEQIEKVCKFIRSKKQDVCIMCDNCYGEFMDIYEPTQAGVDLMAGSLIKNPGGGIVPTGGYICGKKQYVDLVGFRLTSPSIGMEVGSYAYGYKDFYQGFFLAPHIVAQAVKGSLLFGKVFEELGFDTMPKVTSKPNDIIRSIKFDTKDQLITFCRTIQEISPVDSNLTLEPWDMPGYEDQVIMAAGSFVAGSSIELSADSPIKEPYIAYLQGGLTYEHVKLACMYCVQKLKLM